MPSACPTLSAPSTITPAWIIPYWVTTFGEGEAVFELGLEIWTLVQQMPGPREIKTIKDAVFKNKVNGEI